MKKYGILFLLFSTFMCMVLADMPGNKPRPACEVSITGVDKMPDYTFFSVLNRLETTKQIHEGEKDTIPGGFGAPMSLEIYAVNKAGQKTKNSLFIFGGAYKAVLTIDTIISDSIIGNAIETYDELPTETNSKKEEVSPLSRKDKVILIGVAILGAIVLGIAFFIHKKKSAKIMSILLLSCTSFQVRANLMPPSSIKIEIIGFEEKIPENNHLYILKNGDEKSPNEINSNSYTLRMYESEIKKGNLQLLLKDDQGNIIAKSNRIKTKAIQGYYFQIKIKEIANGKITLEKNPEVKSMGVFGISLTNAIFFELSAVSFIILWKKAGFKPITS